MLGMARRCRRYHPSASTSHHTRDQFLRSVGAAAVLTRSCKNFSRSRQLSAPFRALSEHRVFPRYLSIHLNWFFFFSQKTRIIQCPSTEHSLKACFLLCKASVGCPCPLGSEGLSPTLSSWEPGPTQCPRTSCSTPGGYCPEVRDTTGLLVQFSASYLYILFSPSLRSLLASYLLLLLWKHSCFLLLLFSLCLKPITLSANPCLLTLPCLKDPLLAGFRELSWLPPTIYFKFLLTIKHSNLKQNTCFGQKTFLIKVLPQLPCLLGGNINSHIQSCSSCLQSWNKGTPDPKCRPATSSR